MYSLHLHPGLPLLSTAPPATDIDPLSYVSLRHCGTISRGEEKFRVLGLAAPGRWCAVRLERDRLTANFQGDPLWPMEVLEDYPNLANLFGLQSSPANNACIVPLPATINARLAELYDCPQAGDEPHPWFRELATYESFNGKGITDWDYVDQCIDMGAFPVSPVETKDSVHDWSYHFLTLLFPKYVDGIRRTLACVRAQLSKYSGSSRHSWNYFGHSTDEDGNFIGKLRAEVMPYRHALYRQMAITLDSATAKLVQFLIIRKRGKLDRCASEIDAASVFLSGVTDRSVRRALFMEPPQSGVQAPGMYANAPKQDILDYLISRLDELEARASRLIDPGLVASRKRAFEACLGQIEPLLAR